jgi:GTPase SAR1 family protein
MAVVKPAKSDEFTFAQSKHEVLPKIPFRMIIAGPSGGGKTVLLQSMMTSLYKTSSGQCPFERIFIWSPSVNADPAWQPVKRYIREKMKVDDKAEQLYFDKYRPEELEAVITEQKKIVAAQKKRGDRRLFSILICVDDFADSAAFSRRSVLLHELYTRGRHAGISTITSVQRYRSLSPIIRVNATSLIVFRLRNFKEYQAIEEENSAAVSRDDFKAIYDAAVAEPYSFLYIDLTAKSVDSMFYLRFERPIVLAEAEEK